MCFFVSISKSQHEWANDCLHSPICSAGTLCYYNYDFVPTCSVHAGGQLGLRERFAVLGVKCLLDPDNNSFIYLFIPFCSQSWFIFLSSCGGTRTSVCFSVLLDCVSRFKTVTLSVLVTVTNHPDEEINGGKICSEHCS